MDDGRGKRLRQPVREPARRPRRPRELPRLVDLPELREALHLPLEVAARPSERGELGSGDVGRVDLGERVDEVEPEPAARSGVSRARAAARSVTTWPVEEAHHVEVHAEDALVVADGDDLRQADALRHECELQPRLAHHVVRRRRQRRARRAAEHEPLGAALEQEGEVRAAADADPASR